jgi:hypothetical protein
MTKYKIIFFITGLVFVLPLLANAQQQWMVYFKDKQRNNFNPYAYFDSKAIERRIRTGLPVDDPTDWPVNSAYVEVVSQRVNEVIMSSRWFNSVAVEADVLQIAGIRGLTFVLGVEEIEPIEAQITSFDKYDTAISTIESEVLRNQLYTLGVETWCKAGINGKGLRIAIFDVGFVNADKVPAFDHIRNENRLIATHDFTKRGNSENVYYGNAHGTEVWSCVAGKIGDLQIGLATGA